MQFCRNSLDNSKYLLLLSNAHVGDIYLSSQTCLSWRVSLIKKVKLLTKNTFYTDRNQDLSMFTTPENDEWTVFMVMVEADALQLRHHSRSIQCYAQ